MERFNLFLVVGVFFIFGVTIMVVSGNLGTLSSVLNSFSNVLDSFNQILQSLNELTTFKITIYTIFRKERK